MYDIRNLSAFKKSTIAFLLGSGQSIRRIADEEWEIIKRHDIWTVNNWIYHPFIIPDFYHVEAKKYNFEVLQRRFREKKESYKLVKFIFPRKKTLRMRRKERIPLSYIVPDSMMKFEYSLRSRDIGRTHNPFNADYVMDGVLLTKSYDMSMTILFELLYKFDYEVVVLYGIDLLDSYYFWTNWKECGEVHHQTNKEHEGKDPNSPHNTIRIKDFIIDFNNRWMIPNGREIFVGHTRTGLHPELDFVDIRAFA